MSMYEKRIRNFDYKWLPPHERFAALAPASQRKETRKPWFVLVSRDGHNSDILVYFVNLTDETLTLVDCSMAGFHTEDDGVSSFSGKTRGYRNVERGEAVLVDVIDIIADSDWSLTHSIEVESPGLGHVGISALRGKGKFKDMELIWDTGEAAKGVSVFIEPV